MNGKIPKAVIFGSGNGDMASTTPPLDPLMSLVKVLTFPADILNQVLSQFNAQTALNSGPTGPRRFASYGVIIPDMSTSELNQKNIFD